ncbi:uncharacterized protein N7482_002276 [Penicillium canariense]|uniref:Uncharacterized protein n=1 Tax=Penicillium canariense TaxID=189055 RepID=A0A9W9IHI4_9EURO|nr:uncharacterized protein N7482_002276 [Penicillium canariense]KAJ5176399.1 hypothetical protein N7482_002276 [Penicillium canariense]
MPCHAISSPHALGDADAKRQRQRPRPCPHTFVLPATTPDSCRYLSNPRERERDALVPPSGTSIGHHSSLLSLLSRYDRTVSCPGLRITFTFTMPRTGGPNHETMDMNVNMNVNVNMNMPALHLGQPLTYHG